MLTAYRYVKDVFVEKGELMNNLPTDCVNASHGNVFRKQLICQGGLYVNDKLLDT